MTDQKRYQVFVSSTYLDLRDERQAVTAALLECDAFPAGMELFPAADDDAWTLITKVIDESDYYLLVVGGKYGSVDPVEDVSYTEKEYDYAVSKGKPVMAFVHGDPGSIVADKTELGDLRDKLEAFREKVKAAKHVKYWTSAEGLAGQVALTYNKFTRLYPAVGWIRADRATSTESLQALADARTRIDELEAKLGTARTAAPEGSDELAQGADTFDLPFWATARYMKGGTRRDVRAWLTLKPSWDEVFSGIAPRLLQECEEAEVREVLQRHVMLDQYSLIIAGLIEEAAETGDTVTDDDLNGLNGNIHDEDFGTILVQLMALGLITRSDKKRSVTDTGTYWTVTPYGETRTIQLRALKRTATSLGGGSPAGKSDDVDPTSSTGSSSEAASSQHRDEEV